MVDWALPNQVPWRSYESQIVTVKVSGGVNRIGFLAFYHCPELKSVYLPDSVKEIGMYAFGECGQLKTISMSEQLKSVGMFAFDKCGALETVYLPASLKTIPENAFDGCGKLHDVYYGGSSDEASFVNFGLAEHHLKRATWHYNHVHAQSTGAEEQTCTQGATVTHDCPCGKHFGESEYLPPLGHSYVCKVTDPTCAAEGSRVYTCSRCNDTYTETIPALGHSYAAVVTAPTCRSDGYTTHTCSRCQDSYTDSPVPALGHSYACKVTDPTCTGEGSRVYTCSRCNDTYTEAIPALGHAWESGFTVDKKATYSAAGSKSIHCSACSAKKEITEIPKLAKKSLSSCTVTLSTTAYSYSGDVRKPAVTVKNGSKTISASNYTVTYASGRKNVGTYKVTVTAKSGNYPISGSKTLTFKINPKGTSLSSLTKGPKSFTVVWKKQSTKMASSHISGYQIQYSTSSKFADGYTTKVTIPGYSYTSKKVTGLKVKARYYVRVRTYMKVGETAYVSGWSAAKSVVTDPPVTTPPAKPSISSARALSFKTASATWGGVSGAKGYQFKYSTSSSFSTATSVYTTGKSVQLSGLQANKTYYVKVRAYKTDYYGKKVYGSWSATKSFKTAWTTSATSKYNSYVKSGISKLNAAATYAKKVSNLEKSDLSKAPSYLASTRSNVNAAKSYFQKARDFAAGNPKESRSAVSNCKQAVTDCGTAATAIKTSEDKAREAIDKGTFLTLKSVSIRLYGVNAWNDVNLLLKLANSALL